MTDVNDLLVRIDATTEQLRREMRRAEQVTQQGSQRMDRSLRQVDRGFDRVNRAAQTARTAIAAVVSVLAIRRMQQYVGESVSMANTIDKTANAAAITTDRVQELRFAFGQLADISDNQVDRALVQFNTRLGQARQGNAQLQDAFERLDVRLDQHTRPALEATLSALASIRDPAARGELAVRLFGERAGPQLAAALDQGIGSLDELAAKLRDDGGVISEDSVKKAAELNDVMDKLNRQFSAQRTEAILEYSREIGLLAEGMGTLQRAGIGAIGTLARFGAAIGEALAGEGNVGALARGAQISDVRTRMAEVRAELERFPQHLRLSARGEEMRGALRSELAELEAELARLEGRQAATLERTMRRDGSAPQIDSVPTFIPSRAERPEIDILPLRDPDDPRFREAERFLQATRTDIEQIEIQIQRVQSLTEKGFFPDGVGEDVLERLQERLREIENQGEDMGQKIRDSLALTAGGALEEMFARGEMSMSNFAEAVLRDMARIMAQLLVIKPLMDSLFSPGGVLGGFGIPGFASGTNSAPGGAAVVGERGPEIVNLPRGSQVIPNHQLRSAAGGGGAVVQVIDQRGAGEPAIEVQRDVFQGQEMIKVMVRSEVGSMLADGTFERQARAFNMPLSRRGSR